MKLWDTEAAARAIAPLVSGETAVVSFRTAWIKDDVLRSVLGDDAVVGGVSYIAAAIAEPGVIAHNGTMQRLDSANLTEGAGRCEAFLEACRRSKIDAELSGDIQRAIWEKFVFLVGLSGTTATMRATIGPPLKPADTCVSPRRHARGRSGRAGQGVTLAADIAENRLAFCGTLPETMTSSMAVDMERGNQLKFPGSAGASSSSGPSLEQRRRSIELSPTFSRSPPTDGADARGSPPPHASILGGEAGGCADGPSAWHQRRDHRRGASAVGRPGDRRRDHGTFVCVLLSRVDSPLAEAFMISARLWVGARVEPLELSRGLAQRFELPGLVGPLAMAASAIDVAAWDALAVAAGLPLSTLLARPRGRSTPTTATVSASCRLRLRRTRLKSCSLKDFRPSNFASATRSGCGSGGGARRAEAKPRAMLFLWSISIRRSLCRGDAGCAFSTTRAYVSRSRHDTTTTIAAQIAEAVKTPIQAGENFPGGAIMASLAAAASDYVMLDLDRIGGVSGWRNAAAWRRPTGG